MAGEKSNYRGFTEAQARAHKKYIARFVEVKIRMEPEQRDSIKSHAEARGESLNAFINRAIQEAMEREKARPAQSMGQGEGFSELSGKKAAGE